MTPRRFWFPLYTTLLQAAIPHAWVATIGKLGMLMVERWGTHRLTDEQATRTRISAGELLHVTGESDAESAVEQLRAIGKHPDCIALKVKALGNGFTEVVFPKLAESLKARRPRNVPLTSDQRPTNVPSSSSSSSSSPEEEKKKKRRREEKIERQEPLAPEDLVRLLSKLPGDPDAKLAWLTAELPLIELLAAEDHPCDAPRRLAAVKSRVFRHYKQHLKNREAAPDGGALTVDRVLKLVDPKRMGA